MTDAGLTISGDALLQPRRLADGMGARLAEQVSVEADRVGGTIKDGVEAARAASKTYGDLLSDGCARVIRASMRNNAELGDHLLALVEAKTPAEAFALNGAFVQKQISAMPSRALEILGLKGAAAGAGRP